jgi:hypothetical protein
MIRTRNNEGVALPIASKSRTNNSSNSSNNNNNIMISARNTEQRTRQEHPKQYKTSMRDPSLEKVSPLDVNLRSLPADNKDSPSKPLARRKRPQQSRRQPSKDSKLHNSGSSLKSEHSKSSIESGATSQSSSIGQDPAVTRQQHIDQDSQPTSIAEQYDPRDLLRVQRRPAKSESVMYSSAPSRLEYSIEEEPESKTYTNPARESPVLLSKLSEQLLKLERKVQKITSRELMELSEKIGLPVAYSNGRGLELVDRERMDIVLLTDLLQRVLREDIN